MYRRRKAVLFILVGVIGLMVLALLFKFYFTNQYRSQIPDIAEYHNLLTPARNQLDDALKKAQRNPSAENLGRLGMISHSCANYEQAAQCYELAIRRKKSEWLWYYYLGYLSMEMGESNAVIENFNRVIERNPNIYHAWFYIGESYRNLRMNDAAERSFVKITDTQNSHVASEATTRKDQFPLDVYAKFQLSRIYFETGRLDLAEETLNEIVQSFRMFGPAYRLLSSIYSTNGDMLLSKRYEERANDQLVYSPPVDTLVDRLVLLSRSEFFLLKMIDEAQRNMHSEWALRLVNNAIQYIPDNKYVISKALKIFMWTELDEKAIALTDQHLSYFQEDFTELYNVGILFFRNSLYRQTIDYFALALDIKPEDIDIQEKLAISYWSVGEKQRSYEVINELLENNPNNPEVLAGIANILYYNFKDTEKASGYLPGLLKAAPSNPMVQKLSAGIAEKNGDFQKAIALYESSIRGNPEDITTIRFLGTSLTNHEMWGKSIRHYKEALEYHPNDPYFLERLGTLLIGCPDTSLRDIYEGKDYLERAFLHMSTTPSTLVYAGRGLAFAYANLGDKYNANKIIMETIGIAQGANFSQSYQNELKDLYDAIQIIED